MRPIPVQCLRAPQTLKGLVRMYERHSQSIADVLLGEGKRNGAAFSETKMFGAGEEVQQKVCGPLHRRAATHAEQLLIDHPLLAGTEPREIECERGMVAVELPQPFARKHAKHH